jgi:uncharacterized protein
MKEYLEKPGYKYKFKISACVACEGRCCIGNSGYIWTSVEEQKAIAELLKIKIDEFKKEYLIFVNGKYSIKELKINDVYYCVFFDTEKKCCSIYDVRPEQCRSFPFWEYYRDETDLIMDECPGIEKL